jgi:hypothetical protein
MDMPQVHIALSFAPEDQAWIRRSERGVPSFWSGHATAPALGDVLRIGGRQFAVLARVWEHDGARPVMRLYLGPGRADTDTVFQDLPG